MGNACSFGDQMIGPFCDVACTFHTQVYDISHGEYGGEISMDNPMFNGECTNIYDSDYGESSTCDIIEAYSIYPLEEDQIYFEHQLNPELAGAEGGVEMPQPILVNKQDKNLFEVSDAAVCPEIYFDIFNNEDFDIAESCCACGGGEKTCTDYETANTDVYGADCRWYSMAAYFGILTNNDCGHFDQAGFNAARDCCACGGGVRTSEEEEDSSSLEQVKMVAKEVSAANDDSRPNCLAKIVAGSNFNFMLDKDSDDEFTRYFPAKVFRELGIAEESIRDQTGHCQMSFEGPFTHFYDLSSIDQSSLELLK